MVNLPIKLGEPVEREREGLLQRLELIRVMIESGHELYHYSTLETGVDGQRLSVTHIAFDDAAWARVWRASRH